MSTQLPEIAISVRQPWAWAIVRGSKDIENRSWVTSYRGPVCIHAAKGCTRTEYEDASELISLIGSGTSTPPGLKDIDRGGIIGVARIVDCVSVSDSPWFFGPYGFVLADVRPLEFIPVRGALGFFKWRKNLSAKETL